MNTYLIYDYYLDETTNIPTIGGIQSYIYDLAVLLKQRGYTINILQHSRIGTRDIQYQSWNSWSVICFPKLDGKLNTYLQHVRKYLDRILLEDDIVIFMTHTMNFSIKHKKTISIQHGIYWDIPYTSPRAPEFVEFIFRAKHSWQNIRKINDIPNTVAVDYNFLNWYRTQLYSLRTNITVIPNYTETTFEIKRDSEKYVNILFARRMEKYRGTEIFSSAAKKLLSEEPTCSITFAGDGPELKALKDIFKDNDRVRFIKFKHGESLDVHQKHDIAVVCSIGSEGTSLSLLEAMASSCAVIATNVGGMTNIILKGYNGLMVDANSEDLYKALKLLVTDKGMRDKLAHNAYQTVTSAFSKQQWEKRWNDYISNIEEQ